MIIYVCSQLRGNPPYTRTKYNKNLKNAQEYCREVMAKGHTPVAPHLYFKELVDDQIPEEREKGRQMGIELLVKCDEVWVFGAREGITDGMKAEIEKAGDLKIAVRYM